MHEFDQYCTILDPEKPNRKDCYRRIWLGNQKSNYCYIIILHFSDSGDIVSCIITVSPYNIFRMPNIHFLGPDRLVNKFSQKLNDNISDWNCENGIYQGILQLLGILLIKKKNFICLYILYFRIG